jgi:pimeloyl-ACP methyl ester carboxylesterase
MPTIVLIHGLWLTARSWEGWKARFEERGYEVLAPAWPRMEGEVEALRRDPSVMNELGLAEVVDHYDRIVRGLDTPPVIMGHSTGGLVTELLLDRGLGAAGIGLSPAPVKGVLRLPPALLRTVFPALRNPSNKNKTVGLTPKQFHRGFTNTMSDEDAQAAYERYAVAAPGRAIFQAAFARRHQGRLPQGRPPAAARDREHPGPHDPGLGEQGGRDAHGQVAGRGGLQGVHGAPPLPGRARLGGGGRLRARMGEPPR